eukprot:3439365-Rhodomonas_salina.1
MPERTSKFLAGRSQRSCSCALYCDLLEFVSLCISLLPAVNRNLACFPHHQPALLASCAAIWLVTALPALSRAARVQLPSVGRAPQGAKAGPPNQVHYALFPVQFVARMQLIPPWRPG